MKAIYIEDGTDEMVRAALKEEAEDLYNCKEFEAFDITKGERKVICEQIRNAVESAGVIYFDYGGLMYWGSFGGLVDYWNRFFVKLIEDHPNKKWFCRSALNTFDDEDKKNLKDLGVNFVIENILGW